jgi:hypothetical protein
LKAATEDKVVEKPAHVGTVPSLESNVEEIESTICAKPIQNYEPDYFHGIETNPACDDCKPPSVKAQKSEVDHSDVSSELPLTTRDSTCLASTNRDFTYLDSTPRDSTYLVTTNMKAFSMDTTQVNSVQPPKKSLFPPWTCDVCQTDIPWGQTWEQTIHSKKHREEPKD